MKNETVGQNQGAQYVYWIYINENGPTYEQNICKPVIQRD